MDNTAALAAMRTSKDALLDKMARMPKWATHVGISNVPGLGVTVVVASDLRTPHVFDPRSKEWVPLQTKTPGGLVI